MRRSRLRNLLGYRTGAYQDIGMARSGFQKNSEPFQVVMGHQRRKDLDIATIASTRIEMQNPGRFYSSPCFKIFQHMASVFYIAHGVVRIVRRKSASLLIEIDIQTGNGGCNHHQINHGAIRTRAARHRGNRKNRHVHDGKKDGRDIELPVSEFGLFRLVFFTAGIGLVLAMDGVPFSSTRRPKPYIAALMRRQIRKATGGDKSIERSIVLSPQLGQIPNVQRPVNFVSSDNQRQHNRRQHGFDNDEGNEQRLNEANILPIDSGREKYQSHALRHNLHRR